MTALRPKAVVYVHLHATSLARRTPHDRHRWVDATRTHRLTPDEIAGLHSDNPVTVILTRERIRRRVN